MGLIFKIYKLLKQSNKETNESLKNNGQRTLIDTCREDIQMAYRHMKRCSAYEP